MSAKIYKCKKRKVKLSPYFDFQTEESRVTSPVQSSLINNFSRPNNYAKWDLTYNERTENASISAMEVSRLQLPFFNIPCTELAKALLGKIFVRKMSNGALLKGQIVETESYLGNEDKASISYGGKITEKSKPMYMKPGTTFVYLTYGMYNLINISSYGAGAAVLIRALDPIEGLELMAVNRNQFQPNKNKPKKEIKNIPSHQLCNGPAKLCISLDITKEKCNMQDLSTWSDMWLEPGEDIHEEQIVKSRRIGIDSAGPEWANKLLRFYVLNNKSVSKLDKAQERLLISGESK